MAVELVTTGTGIKYEKRVNGTQNFVRSERSNRENGPTFLDFPLFPGISFQWDEPTKRFPIFAEPKFPEILTKWKAPVVDLVSESKALYCLF